MPEKSNPFKGIPSLFSRSSKKQDEVMPSTSEADSRQSKNSAPRADADARQLIADSKFFNASWYLNQNPDVAAAHIDPLEHYFTCGEKEGRNPGPEFDVAWYTKKYPEIAATGIGAFEHYLRRGYLENKSTSLADYRTRLENDPGLAEENRALKSAPLKLYTSPPLARRVNLLIDSISFKKLNDKSFDQGEATRGNLEQTDIEKANLEHANLEHANLEHANLEQANLEHANLEHANLEQTNLEQSTERGLQVAVLLAAATGSSLRVVTRVARARVSGFKNFLFEQKLQIPAHVEFAHCDYVTAQASLPTSRWDIFITVDEVNDACIRDSMNEKNIFSLIAATTKRLPVAGDALSATVSELVRSCENVFV